jgi:hypothetical protein
MFGDDGHGASFASFSRRGGGMPGGMGGGGGMPGFMFGGGDGFHGGMGGMGGGGPRVMTKDLPCTLEDLYAGARLLPQPHGASPQSLVAALVAHVNLNRKASLEAASCAAMRRVAV